MSEENSCNEDKTPGIFSWNELSSQDIEGSVDFYTGLLGWTADVMEMPGGMTYTMFMNGERPVAGLMEPPVDVPAHWLSYITVENLEATVSKAEGLGAKTIVPPTTVPEKGRFAVITDPQGATIAFWSFL